LPDGDSSLLLHSGNSFTQTIQGGFQLNLKINQTLGVENFLTFGTEYLLDDVFDELDSYNYLMNQSTQNFGYFYSKRLENNTSTERINSCANGQTQ